MSRTHWYHVIFGAMAGLGLWAVFELARQGEDLWYWPGLAVFALSFGAAALAMLGEVGPRRALLAGGAIALVAAGLVQWQAQGFVPSVQVFETGHVLLAALILSTLPIPFAMTLMRFGSAGWHDYPDLFMDTWNVVVRFASASLFASVSMGVLFLLSELLHFVGVDLLRDLLREEAVVMAVGGAACGLGLAVVYEFSEMISPVLVLRLLRLLAPVVLLVVVIFVVAFLLQGATFTLGGLSASEVLITTALGAIALVSIALDQDDAEAVQGRFMRSVARALAGMVPVLAALLVLVYWRRVSAEGWTPTLVVGVAAVAVICGYGLAYGASALRAGGWMERIRRANIVMALGIVGLAALWLTPLIEPEQIAVRSQIARYQADTVKVVDLPLAEMRFDWGPEGQAGLAQLREMAAEDTELAALLTELDAANSSWEFYDAERRMTAMFSGSHEEWLAAIERVPAGDIPQPLLDTILRDVMGNAIKPADCRGEGNRDISGCLLLRADLVLSRPGEEALVVIGRDRTVQYGNTTLLTLAASGEWIGVTGVAFVRNGADAQLTGRALLEAIRAGDFAIEPAGIQQLRVGDSAIVINEGGLNQIIDIQRGRPF